MSTRPEGSSTTWGSPKWMPGTAGSVSVPAFLHASGFARWRLPESDGPALFAVRGDEQASRGELDPAVNRIRAGRRERTSSRPRPCSRGPSHPPMPRHPGTPRARPARIHRSTTAGSYDTGAKPPVPASPCVGRNTRGGRAPRRAIVVRPDSRSSRGRSRATSGGVQLVPPSRERIQRMDPVGPRCSSVLQKTRVRVPSGERAMLGQAQYSARVPWIRAWYMVVLRLPSRQWPRRGSPSCSPAERGPSRAAGTARAAGSAGATCPGCARAGRAPGRRSPRRRRARGSRS